MSRGARYVAWDGTQEVRLDPEKIFAAFAEALSQTDNVEEAIQRLLTHGLDTSDLQVMGLDELLEKITQERDRLMASINLDEALWDHQASFAKAIKAERSALREAELSEDHLREKEAFLDDLGLRLSSALPRVLARHAFLEEMTRRDLMGMSEDLDSIRRVEEAQRRWGRRLRGPDALSFPETLEFLDRLDALAALADSLVDGNLGEVDPAELGQFLGAAAQAGLEALQGMVMTLVDAGHFREREGRMELTPQAIRRLGQMALREIYDGFVRDRSGAHGFPALGHGAPSADRLREWEFGDALNLALGPTLLRAVQREPGNVLRLVMDDFVIREPEQETSAATVLLLDMSWSMSWEGRFVAAKKVALALETLVRTRFPRDYLGIVGFYTRAVELTPRTLPEATWSMGDPFTNLQDGLRMADSMLRRQASRNQQVIVITDGQPTAYFREGQLYCEWPMSMGGVSERAARATLEEVVRLTRRGVTINTFMLDDSSGLREFVAQMTQINRGRALYTNPDQLGSYLMVDYLGRKTKKV